MQIGQVMLALPNAIALTGLRAGVPLLFMYSLFSMFTIHLLNALYCEYKARKVSNGLYMPPTLYDHLPAFPQSLGGCFLVMHDF